MFMLWHRGFLCIKFVGIEGVVTAVVDWLPHHLRRGYRKEIFTAFVCAIWFIIGLSMVTEVHNVPLFVFTNTVGPLKRG